MKLLKINTEIHKFDTCEEFYKELNIGEDDLIITNEYIYTPFFKELNIKTNVVFQEKYEVGEPSDEMVDKMYEDIKKLSYKRVIGIGGGSVLDTAKIFSLETFTPALDLFDKKIEAIKAKELVLVPTTCGTGSEVTNIAILGLKSRDTKLGLAVDSLYADYAYIIPKLLTSLPLKPFAHSSIDALIHAAESALSPGATIYTKMFSYEAIKLILSTFIKIVKEKKDYKDLDLLESLLMASNFAGISIGNVGTGAVHAMSYPLGGKYHIPHGESNYALFTEVFKTYTSLNPNGEIKRLNSLIAEILNCDIETVYDELEILLNDLIKRKPLKEYGVTIEDIADFTENVITKQTRLTKNNYVPLSPEQISKIYSDLY